MSGFPDHYAVLGIDPSADHEVITAAYRALAKKYHPDTGATAGTASAERFEQVQQAYEVLRTPESRRRYDQELLAATERELDEHLAKRQRMIAAGIGSGGLPPPAGIGGIRPEPLAKPRAKGQRASLVPFLVPGLLLVAVVAGGAFLLWPKSPEAPSPVVAAPAPAPAEAPVAKVDAPAPQPAPAKAVEADPPAPQPAPGSPPVLAAKTEPVPPPVFGSSAQTAAATAIGKPAPETAASPAVTASVAPEPVADAAATPVPTPKPKPKLAAKPAPKAQPKPPARQQQLEPPPRPAEAEPPQFVTGAGPHRLVIFEREPGSKATAWSVGVFKNARRCTRFGVKAIIHRMNESGRPTPGEIWYECQPV